MIKKVLAVGLAFVAIGCSADHGNKVDLAMECQRIIASSANYPSTYNPKSISTYDYANGDFKVNVDFVVSNAFGVESEHTASCHIVGNMIISVDIK